MRRAAWVTVMLGAVQVGGGALGQANCALRAPDRQIFEIYPEATTYRTVEATVDESLKPRIEAVLGSDLAPTDEGKHTAYLVLKDGVPIGFVHARAETGRRGSVELVWAMDLDLAIKDFRVQRCRERHASAIKADAFRRKLQGRNLWTLRELLANGNDDVNVAALDVPAEAESIAHTVVLCGLKTRVITETAFQDSILPARLLGRVHEWFPSTARVRRVTAPASAAVLADVERRIGTPPDALDREALAVLRALDADGQPLGSLVWMHWAADERRPEVWWAVSPSGVIEHSALVADVDDDLRRAFEAIVGMSLADLERPDHGADRCAQQVLALLAAQAP